MNKKLISSIIIGALSIGSAAFAADAVKTEAKKETKMESKMETKKDAKAADKNQNSAHLKKIRQCKLHPLALSLPYNVSARKPCK